MTEFVYRSRIPAPPDEVFAWHERPGAFQRLLPPWEKVEILESSNGVRDGAQVVLRSRIGPLWRRWVVRHRDYQPGVQFCDEQIEGPFAHWLHTHRMTPDADGCLLEDRIEYKLPGGAIGEALAGHFTHNKLTRMFRYRHEITRNDIATHRRVSLSSHSILLSGSSGLIGQSLGAFLTTGGHRVVPLVRSRGRTTGEAVQWNPLKGISEEDQLEGFDIVVHLAGENIASKAWSDEQKRRIRESRVRGTKTLVEALTRRRQKPSTLICASAVGFYGNRGEEILDESSDPGTGFLTDLCREWEAAAEPAIAAGIRVVHLRFGTILSPRGGALAAMLPFASLGLGGRLGSGRQFMSWISIDDAVDAIHHALSTPTLEGAVNVVSPEPVTNADFTHTLNRVIRRPTGPPAFPAILRLWWGEMADALLLGSLRVHPTRLLESGYEFHHPDLETALRHVLGRTHPKTE